jgi:hypothetical protein
MLSSKAARSGDTAERDACGGDAADDSTTTPIRP